MNQPRQSLLGAAALAALLFLPARAGAWGSMDIVGFGSMATHQFIDEQAYELLKKNPAFQEDRFPPFDRIRLWGVIDETQSGLGPDSAGATPFDWHYFNPELPEGQRGLGPQKAGDFFADLVPLLIENPQSVSACHNAAWSSHFLADMFVPYHVVGATLADIQRIYNLAGGTNSTAVILTPAIAGNIAKLGDNQWFTPTDDFKSSVEIFLREAAADPKRFVNWCDPWYWNGNVSSSVSSSHLWWEGEVWHSISDSLGLDPTWRNPAPDFDQYLARQAAAVRTFAAAHAVRTRANTVAYWDEPKGALEAAVSATYTLWRAAFTALRPSLDTQRAASSDPDKETYEVTATIVNSDGLDPAMEVKARLKVLSGGKLADGKDIQNVPAYLPCGGSGKCGPWKVETDDAKNCRLKLEVIGGFRNTPDLQYAMIASNIIPVAVSNSVVVLIDCSGSMEGGKVENAKSAAISQVNRLDEATEIAVFSFSGSGSVRTIADFHLPTSKGRAALSAKIKTIGAGGSTALAEAISQGGRYMNAYARGTERRTLVILSDGEETCGGDPAAALAGLYNMEVKF